MIGFVGLLLTIGGLYLVSHSQAAFHATASAFAVRFGVSEITAEDLQARLNAGRPTLLIDVREASEQSVSRIPGSHPSGPRVSLALDPEVRRFAEEYAGNSEALVVVYCAGGYRSARSIAGSRAELNIPLRNLHGGIVAHANAGGALEGSDGQPTSVVHSYSDVWARFVLPPTRATTEPPVAP